jgi:hypothetical protein
MYYCTTVLLLLCYQIAILKLQIYSVQKVMFWDKFNCPLKVIYQLMRHMEMFIC